MRDFMVALMQGKKEELAASPQKSQKQEHLRKQALLARRHLRKAKKLVMMHTEMSEGEHDLIGKLDSGELEKSAIQSNKAYGYGRGVTNTSREDAALLRVTGNKLDEYFGRSY